MVLKKAPLFPLTVNDRVVLLEGCMYRHPPRSQPHDGSRPLVPIQSTSHAVFFIARCLDSTTCDYPRHDPSGTASLDCRPSQTPSGTTPGCETRQSQTGCVWVGLIRPTPTVACRPTVTGRLSTTARADLRGPHEQPAGHPAGRASETEGEDDRRGRERESADMRRARIREDSFENGPELTLRTTKKTKKHKKT